MTPRYQVFTQRSAVKPQFSAPWYWAATMYSMFFCGDYCRIVDAKRNEPMIEWARAKRGKPQSDK